MKKVFTLIAGMLIVCGSITAQTKWTNLVVNGNMEGESPAYENLEAMQAEGAAWNSFWSHEFPKNEIGEEQYQGTATIVVDPTNPNNHCVRVVARSEAIADSCENKTKPEGQSNLASWDCQFFIYATEAIPQDRMVRLTMKVRADKAGKAETQAHWAPGDYNHYQLFGDINVTTEWQTITTDEIIVSADQCKEGEGKHFQSVAFNLSTDVEGNVFYFDEIKLEMKEQSEVDPSGEWVNFFRKGTLTNDKFGNFTTFTQRNGATSKDEPAEVYMIDDQPTLKVTTVAWNTEGVLKNAEGKDSLDSDSLPVIAKYYIVDNDTILSSDSRDKKDFNDWQTQFFAMSSHKFKTNQPFRFKMWARAARVDGQPLEEEISIDTQIHTTPGGYIHYDFVGSLSVGEEWTPFEFGYDEENPKTIPSQGNGGQTIAFNCNKNKDVPVDLFFRFEELAFQEGVVLPSERVLASSSVRVPLSVENEGETTGTIDLNEALQVLEVPASDFAKFVDDSKTIKVKYLDENEDEAYQDAQLSAGISIDANGNWTESQNNVITLEANEDETKDGILGLTISNYGVALEAGQTIDAKIAFEKDFWRYLVNVSFVEANAYAGVNEVKVTPKTNVMYDLQGRQLINAAKGLYIMNGKKVLVK